MSETISYLRRFVNGGDSRPDSQRHSRMLLVGAIHEPGPLVTRPAPVVEKTINDAGVLEHDVIHVAVRLTVQSDGANRRG